MRAYATNSVGTGYGSVLSFLTSGLPVLTTSPILDLGMNSITCGGNIETDGGTPIVARGVCYSTSEEPTIEDDKTEDGTGTGEFTSYVFNLTASTTYYIRAYATNEAGETAYGLQLTFTTLGENQIADYDGNIYNTITIGTQTWTVENLKVKHYRNGEEIIWGYDNWTEVMTGPACTQYNGTSAEDYGLLYNWYAVMDPRNIAPQGWHVPTLTEYKTLETFLGGAASAYIALMEEDNAHWVHNPNTGTNSSGWTALPGGIVEEHGWHAYLGTQGRYWLSSVTGPGIVDWFQFTYTTCGDRILYEEETRKYVGQSVRLIKD